MRADRAGWAGWWRQRGLSPSSRKDFDVLPTPVIDPLPSKGTTSHIHPPRCGKDSGLRFDRGWCWEQTMNGTDPTCSVAFGSACLTALRASDKVDSHPTAPHIPHASVNAFSGCISLNQRVAPVGQRSETSSCRGKALAGNWPRPLSLAHCQGP